MFNTHCNVSSDYNKISKCHTKIAHIGYPCNFYNIASYKGFKERH